MSSQPACPLCNQDDRVAKVSAIYIKAAEISHASRKTAGAAPDRFATAPLAALEDFSPSELEALSKLLKPPASRAEAFSRPLQPDQVVVVFSLIVPFFLYKVFVSQPDSLPLALAALAAFYGFYFWQRRAILQRFAQRQRTSATNDARVRRAVERWMNLYYCASDDIVFDPSSGACAPPDQVAGLVYPE